MILKLIGAALILTASAFLLKSFGWRGAPIFTSLALILFIAEAEGEFEYIFSSIKKIGLESGIEEALSAAVKVLGLGYLFGISADICRELGESGIAKSLEVVGRVEIIAVAVPFWKKIIETGVELMG